LGLLSIKPRITEGASNGLIVLSFIDLSKPAFVLFGQQWGEVGAFLLFA
jgi:hypothetical protein